MPNWAFALFLSVAFSGWCFAATFYGMYRIEKHVREKMHAHWIEVAQRAGLIAPEPPLRVVKPPDGAP